MEQITITLRPRKTHLELHEFLTIARLVSTGGMANQAIKSGQVMLNGVIETRKRKKLTNDDVIKYLGKEHKLTIV